MLVAIVVHRHEQKCMISTPKTYTQAPFRGEACFGTYVLAKNSGISVVTPTTSWID